MISPSIGALLIQLNVTLRLVHPTMVYQTKYQTVFDTEYIYFFFKNIFIVINIKMGYSDVMGTSLTV